MMLRKTVLLVAILGCGIADAALAQQYSVTDLGTLGGTIAIATGINSNGQVVGASTTATGADHAFIWSNGVMQDLGVLPGLSECFARAINDLGQVVGHCQAGSQSQGFIWTAAQGIQPLTIASGAIALAINNNGAIAGTYAGPSGSEAFMWDGTFHDLGPGTARGINDQGQVVGEDANSFAMLWDSTGAHSLGALPGNNASFAFAINASGLAVGNSSNFGQTVAVVWTPYGIGNLGTLGGPSGEANAINGSLIVGGTTDSSNSPHAFLYDLSGPGYMIDLNSSIPADSGWSLTGASGVNSSGVIVGDGFIGGAEHAFLLAPVSTSGNLLVKSGFEEYFPPALGAPGWVSDDIRQVPAKSETNQPHTGNQNGACWTTDYLDCGLYQDVQAPASGTYTLTIFANADRPNAWVGANVNNGLAASTEVEVRGFGNYGTAYTLTFQAIKGDTIRVWGYSPATPGYLVIDDVTLTGPTQ